MNLRVVTTGLVTLCLGLSACTKEQASPTTHLPSGSGDVEATTEADDFAVICEAANKAGGDATTSRTAFATAVEAKLETLGVKNTWAAAAAVADDEKLAMLKAGADELGLAEWDCPAIELIYGRQRDRLADHVYNSDGERVVEAGVESGDGGVVSAGAAARAKEIFDRIRKNYLGGLKACFDSEKKREPALAGTVKVSFTLKKDGRIETGSADGFHDKVDDCMTRLINQWTFAPSDEDQPTYTLPIVFR